MSAFVRIVSAVAALAAAGLTAGQAMACYPTAATSDVHWHDGGASPYLCPAGCHRSTIDVTVRDQFGAPMASIAASEIYVEGCHLVAGTPLVSVTRIYASASTNGSGTTTIVVAGGAGECQTLRVWARASQLATLTFKSVDFTGDGSVNLADLGYMADAFNRSQGESGYSADFDFNSDGRVALADLGVFADHYQHRWQ